MLAPAAWQIVSEWPITLQSVLSGAAAATFVLASVLFVQALRFSTTAQYRIWKRQNARIERLEEEPKIAFNVSNADEYLLGRSYYMLKVTNFGQDRTNCLIRLVSVADADNIRELNAVLPTKGQWENESRGAFNLRTDESKHVMLIGNFPTGWCFLLENGLSDPYTLERPLKVRVAIYGGGPSYETVILIELLDPHLKLLRLTVLEATDAERAQ